VAARPDPPQYSSASQSHSSKKSQIRHRWRRLFKKSHTVTAWPKIRETEAETCKCAGGIERWPRRRTTKQFPDTWRVSAACYGRMTSRV